MATQKSALTAIGRGAKSHAGLGALLALLPLVALSTWLWWNASQATTRSAQERFSFRISEVRFAIEQRLLAYEHVLHGGVGLFAASDEVTRNGWHAYVRALQIDKRYPGVQGIGFSKRITPAEREAHIGAVRAEGFPEYTIRPAGERSDYTSIVYLEPFDWRNQRAFGYDMFSEPVRREAMDRARDSGLPSVSGRVTLVQETSQAVQSGFLMYLPVFRKGAALDTIEARRAALLGYVYAPFRMKDLMQGILGAEKLPDIDFKIFDGAAISPESLMYDSLERSEGKAPAFSASKVFEFNGRRWTVRFSSLPAFEANIDAHKPLRILLSGLLVSFLFAAVVWSLFLNRHRTRELADANTGLQAEIARRTKLEGALKQAKEAADAANQAKSDFLANVSHELRTPLTLILAPLEQLLVAQQPVQGWRAQLERAQRNALLLLNRVNDILDFSKAEAGKLDVRWQAVDLVNLVSTLAGDAAAVAEDKDCTLTWRIDPVLDTVCLDRNHMEKILLNLLSNALKFTPSGGWIRIEATPVDDEWFEIAAADSGVGIPSDKLPLLFKRFQQVDASATRQHGGTGIGLALVKEMAEQMGGAVDVQSETGHGSRFSVRLPRGRDRLAHLPVEDTSEAVRAATLGEAALRRIRLQDGSHQTLAASRAEVATTAHTGSLPHALVVDDNRDMRTYIAGLLREDCNVLTAAHGEEAWSLLQRQRIDVVISDVMMPELDGRGLMVRIKANPTLCHVPVILVTARGGADASVSGLETGADDYIAKPFSPLELRARVRAVLRMGEVQARLRQKSREAGMAMVTTDILHNLGNVLNGVTVSTSIIHDKLRQSKLPKLQKVVHLLEEHVNDLPAFIAEDNRGQVLPAFLAELSEHLKGEQTELLKEVDVLRACAEHVVSVIASRQNFARPHTELREMVSTSSLIETALTLNRPTFDMHGIVVERDYAYTGSVPMDRHKVLQILLNLLSNARHAVRDTYQPQKRIRVRTALSGDRVRLEVSDNGGGIDPKHVPLLFNHGFTTKKAEGNGFGLHSSANWARESGGTLACHSDGPGRGATFILELPARLQDEQDKATEPVTAVLSC